jgi:hypothetical protein
MTVKKEEKMSFDHGRIPAVLSTEEPFGFQTWIKIDTETEATYSQF